MSHIEFLGLPGSGKTTVYEKIIEKPSFYNLQSSDFFVTKPSFDASMYVQKMSYLCGFLQRVPNYVRILYNAMTDAYYDKVELTKLFLGTIINYESNILCHPSDKNLLFDELFFQRLLSIYFRCRNKQMKINRYLNSIPLPSIIIYIDTPVDVCIQQQKRRNKNVTNEYWLNNINDKDMLKRLYIFCTSIIDHVKKKGVEVIKIDNTGTIENVVENIISNLNDYHNI